MIALGISCFLFGQTKPLAESQKSTTCSVNIKGNNNSVGSLSCTNIDANLAKQLKDIAEGASRDANLLRTILTRLRVISSQLRDSENVQIFNDHGIAISSGSTVLNPTVNNYGTHEPPPRIQWLAKNVDPLINLGPYDEAVAKNPGVSITATLLDSFSNPMFMVRCDRPCAGSSAGDGGVSSPRYYSTNHPEIAVIALGIMGGFIPAGEQVFLTVRSIDSQPIHVLYVASYLPTQQK